jgi:predicted membrane channel-forming protein YqfA (hemolysin III family)
MAKFRTDLRILTACWGIVLIVGFIIKAVIASTNTDITKAQNFGYIFFTLATVIMFIVSWLYTKIMKKHVKEQADEMRNEGYENAQWGISAMSNGFNQVVY